jgi:HK97 gp10 family phage protein
VGDVLVDTSRFQAKTRRVKMKMAQTAEKYILEGAQLIYKEMKKNLSGPGIPKRTSASGNQYPDYSKVPGYSTMALPVGRVTGTLARSAKLTRISTVECAIWQDPQIANYGKFVHDGTKYTRPRRYLYDAVQNNKAFIRNSLKKMLKNAIASEGQR